MTVQIKANLAPASHEAAARNAVNFHIASRLRDYADLLISQGDGGFRSQAYRRAADVLTGLERPVDQILAEEGRAGLIALPAIGVGIAGAITEMVTTGHWSPLERLRGDVVPETLFRTIPGIGERLARRFVEEGQLESLEGLENALYFDELAISGLGPRRKRMIAAALAERLGPPASTRSAKAEAPSIDVLLEVDRMYRERAAQGRLHKITPQRFNPTRVAWLPIMHIFHEGWHFTALYSNTRLAHQLNKTHDWVVIYYQRDGAAEGCVTVITRQRGPRAGQRIIKGMDT